MIILVKPLTQIKRSTIVIFTTNYYYYVVIRLFLLLRPFLVAEGREPHTNSLVRLLHSPPTCAAWRSNTTEVPDASDTWSLQRIGERPRRLQPSSDHEFIQFRVLNLASNVSKVSQNRPQAYGNSLLIVYIQLFQNGYTINIYITYIIAPGGPWNLEHFSPTPPFDYFKSLTYICIFLFIHCLNNNSSFCNLRFLNHRTMHKTYPFCGNKYRLRFMNYFVFM